MIFTVASSDSLNLKVVPLLWRRLALRLWAAFAAILGVARLDTANVLLVNLSPVIDGAVLSRTATGRLSPEAGCEPDGGDPEPTPSGKDSGV